VRKNNSSNNSKTKGVETLLGEPKKAIIKLAVPMIIAMSANTIYNLVDAIWVSGFGYDIFISEKIVEVGTTALAAVGYAMPFYMMLISISIGLGTGGGSAISRRIGAKDKIGADNCAIHSIVVSIIVALVFTIILFTFADKIFISIGAADITNMAVSYGRIIFAGSIFIFFLNNALAILRAEGDANRAMYAMLFGAILNIILDPFFIYTFGWGVAGAAFATILSMSITGLILIYWLFLKKDTYVSFKFRSFKFNKEILKDIFRVGLPASIQQLSMAITMLAIILIINFTENGSEGVAVYNAGWRIVMIAILPLLGMATAVISVIGAAFGAHSYIKLKTGYLYAAKVGLLIEITLAVIIFILAPLISIVFSTRPEDIVIRDDLTLFLQISCIFYPSASFGIATSAMFQGTGKGTYSLIATLLRTIVLTIAFALIFVLVFDTGIIGIWWAIVIGNLLGSVISFTWGNLYIRNLILKNKKDIEVL